MVSATGVDVENELASLCGVLNQSHARLVNLVSQALEDESWAIGGVRSAEHWLTMRAGLSPVLAKQVVAVARRSAELPSVMGEFANGQLSLDQVTVVARYTPSHMQESVAEFAVNASVPQLRRSLSRYSFDPPAHPGQAANTTCDTDVGNGDVGNGDVGNDETGDTGNGGNMASGGEAGNGNCEAVNATSWNGFAVVEDRAGAPAELSMSHDEWGRFTLRFSAPADLGALVAAALKEAKDALFGAGRPEVTWADALSEIAGRSLGMVESVNRRDAFRTYVHLDTDGGWLTGRPRLPKHLSDRLTCDGVLQPLWLTGGAPVNVGRAQRIVPTRTRRLVEDRDRGCRFPGCNATAHVECHHVIHWADGGLTDTPNLACLCPYHHDAHHGGEFIVTGDADNPRGLTFTTRRGLPISLGPTFNTPTHPAPTDPTPTDPTPTFTDPNFTDPPPGSACSAPTITITDPDFADPPPGSACSAPTITITDPDFTDRPRGSAWPVTAETVTAPATTAYRGPTGETLHLRHVSFHESPTPAPF